MELREAAGKDVDLQRFTSWSDLMVSQQSEILIPAPFMRPLGERQLGNVYEMRIYTYQAAFMPEVLRRWGESIRYREKYSPPGGLLVHRSGRVEQIHPRVALYPRVAL